MGGCLSTEEDKKKNAKVTRSERQRKTTSYGREDTLPIYINGKGDRAGTEQATSYTDKAMVEQDMFRQIVSRTARNLIDISSQLTPVLDEERASLQQLYSKKMATVKCDASSLFSLPTVSSSNTPTCLRVSSSTDPIKLNQQFIVDSSSQLSRAWAETKEVRDYGRVVIPFEDFSAQ